MAFKIRLTLLIPLIFCLSLVHAQSLPSGITLKTSSLSFARAYLQSATVKQYAFFVGGAYGTGNVYNNLTNAVDIYDTSAKTWSLTTLKLPKVWFGITGLQDVLMVAGGFSTNLIDSSLVEMWNVTTKTWTTSSLSSPRSYIGM